MADKKISALTSATTPLAGTEVLPIVQSGSTVKVAVSDLTAGRSVAASQIDVDNVRIDGNTISSTNVQGDLILDPQRALLIDTTTRRNESIAQVRDLVITPTNDGDYFQQFDVSKAQLNGITNGVAYNLFTASTPLAYGFTTGMAFAGQLFVAVHWTDNDGGQRSHQLIYDIGLGATNGSNLTWQFNQVRDYLVENGGATTDTIALSAVSVSTTSATLAITFTGGSYTVGGINSIICARLIGAAASLGATRKLSILPA